MDFIEKLFGLSPDGGSGALEVSLLAIPFFLLGLRVWWTQTAKKSRPHTETEISHRQSSPRREDWRYRRR
jgi:hypothetical protein